MTHSVACHAGCLRGIVDDRGEVERNVSMVNRLLSSFSVGIVLLIGGCGGPSGGEAPTPANPEATANASAAWASFKGESVDLCKSFAALPTLAGLRDATYIVPDPMEQMVMVVSRDVNLADDAMKPLVEALVKCVATMGGPERAATLQAMDELLAGVMIHAAKVVDKDGKASMAWVAAAEYRVKILEAMVKAGADAEAYNPAVKRDALNTLIKSLDGTATIP